MMYVPYQKITKTVTKYTFVLKKMCTLYADTVSDYTSNKYSIPNCLNK